MTLPADGPTTVALVKAWATVTDDRFDSMIDSVVEAVNGYVRGLPIVADEDADTYPAEFPERVQLGSTMLAARFLRRRNSPDGVVPLTSEGAAYVSRSDPDVAQLLGIGGYERPKVG